MTDPADAAGQHAGGGPASVIDQGFLAAPGSVGDWRGVVLVATALDAGLLEALPADAADAADRLGLSAHAVRVLLDALCEFDVVTWDGRRYTPGPAAPDESLAATLQHHTRAIRRWSTTLEDRLAGTPAPAGGERTAAELDRWLRALANTAAECAPAVADRCLQQFPGARRALDLAGGHGEYGLELARRGVDVALQDLPEVIDIVAGWERLQRSSLALVAGDAFEELAPGPFDLVVCAGFTHTLTPEANAALFTRLAEITAGDGGLAIVTFLRGHNPISPLFAVHMLVAGAGGDTHGLEDYQRWLASAGFAAPQVTDLGEAISLLTAPREG